MYMNHELIDGPLLDDNGDLFEAGYATSLGIERELFSF